ncbi:MAG: glycosyltransferase [Synergistaceae bacterium]|jgi:glycosyltransferase involved in cell wall biosynthesis|nr:glycosyltransferase [Synergistaceae bacterium]
MTSAADARAFKIAFLLRDAGEGGAERSSLRLANGLSRGGCSVSAFFLRAEGPLLGSIDDKIEVVDLKGGFFDFCGRMRAMKFDFLLPVYTSMRALLAKRFMLSGDAADVKVVLSQRNMFTMDRGFIQTKLRFARCRALYPWAAACVCLSNGVADEMRSTGLLPADKIHVVYNPVVTDELRAQMDMPVPPGQLERFGKEGRIDMLAVGRLGPQKDFSTLLRAFAMFSKWFGDARLVILGEGKRRPQLEGLARELGISDRLFMPGYEPNPYPYMKRASLFVMTSLYEGFANVVAEALACGCNVVSTDCPSGPSEILDGGKYGWLARAGDHEDIARKMARAVLSPMPGEVLVERASYFSETRAVDGYRKLFESLLVHN